MKARGSKYGSVPEWLGGPITPPQALQVKGLAEESYQPEQYAASLSFDEAARRTDALKAEIALADSF